MSEKWKLGFEIFNNFANDIMLEIKMRRFLHNNLSNLNLSKNEIKVKTIRTCGV